MHVSLGLPPKAQADENAVHVISVWMTETGPSSSANLNYVRPGHSRASTWALTLADLILHTSIALSTMEKIDPEGTQTDPKTLLRNIVSTLTHTMEEDPDLTDAKVTVGWPDRV
jgi:hypothetical protein